MRKLIFTLCLLLTVGWLGAQQKSDPQVITGSTVLQEKQINPSGAQMYLQVGSPIPYGYYANDSLNLSIRFPWDVAYIPLTFDAVDFEVSKGYFSDKVKLDWTIVGNRTKIEQIRIYRRVFNEGYQSPDVDFELIATLSSDSYTYEDTNTQGGVLYEYKVEAAGVSSIPKKYITHISGVGYRNPTGVVTGNIRFEGNSPVKDVVVRADPQGGELTFGSSLLFNNTSLLSIPLRNKELQDKITLQAWVKMAENSAATLFKLKRDKFSSDDVLVSYSKSANNFNVTVSQSGQSKTFTLSNYYPTGNVDGRGDDTFNAINAAASASTDFSQNFVHVTVVLEEGKEPLFYLNGRNISQAYLDGLAEHVANKPTISNSGSLLFSTFITGQVEVARGLVGHIDEVRLWKSALTEKQIRTDFKRYLGGPEQNLVSYIRCDEKVGSWAYDISKVGIDFNKNHAEIIAGSWSAEKPTASQLGILGVTDAQGNYIISAIPYAGAGESYTITPMFGVHQFEPGQQLVFIGKGSEVINKIDFKDISSFEFLGVAAYTTDGVFAPIQPVENVTFVEEAGYNQYRAIIEGREQLISKSSHYYDTSDPANPVLYETPKVYVPGAHVYIDGDIVLDKDKRPVVTDKNGFFKIRVPIGKHFIEVRKDKHHFTYGGRFPAPREDGNDMFDFFEHQQSAVTFLDTTRVVLVGRVVGGTREADKPIGFGYAGPLKEVYDAGTPQQKTLHISSINNIGQAGVTLSFLPAGALPGGELTHSFSTNPQTGEYKVSVLPLQYTISQASGLRITNNPGIQLLKADEIVNLSTVPNPMASEFTNAEGNKVLSAPYHFVKSFTHRSTPVLEVVSQASDLEVIVKQEDANGNLREVSISTDGFEYAVYTQWVNYAILFQTFEEYINRDAGAGSEVVDKVPITDGEFNITNNLAFPDSEELKVNNDDPSFSTYTFRAGAPSISSPFTRTINIRYRVGGKDYDARSYRKEGIILGGQSDGSQTFITEAPEIPDIILRDPPGSSSSASIEKGKSISFTEEGSFAIGNSANLKVEMKMGTEVALGGGLAGPVVKSELVNSISGGITMKIESTHGQSITKTYTFNETISTSDDPRYVGSNGDLYIGNTKNYYYGTYDNVMSSSQPLGSEPAYVLTNKAGQSVHISKQKAFFFSEEPSETFFIYSQRHIVETLIPELESIVAGIESGAIVEGTPGVLKKTQYQEQIRLWKKVIQDNEQTKYNTLHEREKMKAKIKENLQKQIDDLNGHLIALTTFGAAATVTPGYNYVGVQTLAESIAMFEAKKANLKKKIQFLEEEFSKNISFDAGVGEYSKSSEISVVESRSRNINFDFDATIEASVGFKLNKTGLLLHTNHSLSSSLNTALSEEDQQSTTVKYTLKDGDKSNFLSVDVVNTFDGNGPVFSTLGGRTSCPYEGIDKTLFYNNTAYKNDTEDGRLTNIYSGGEQISYATQRVEIPAISVEVASVTDVPETRAAEFKLILENNSTAGADAFFEIYVDNTTNPHTAKINLLPNGQVVFVPYGQKVEYALTLEKSVSDVYDYKDIVIVLGSLCDPLNEYATVAVSASFRPACTAVKVERPLENWVFNTQTAYNTDLTTNPLAVSLFGYNRAFTGFEKFTLEYRKSTSSSWTRLQTYYNTQELLDAAIAQGEDQGTLISANTTHYAWDIVGMGLADGQYELRVISNCSNGTEFISDVIRGTVDLNVPVQFGTPSPADGILGAGEDLRLRFSEPISFNSALSKIEIKGETNQQQIDHSVSLRFEGAANTMLLEQPNIVAGNFSMEFWLKNETAASGVLFEQTNGMKVVLRNGVMEWTHGGKTLAKPMATDGAFHHYTLTYSSGTNRMSIYQDDMELGTLENASPQLQPNNSTLVVGGNTFVGNLHDLRLWAKHLTLSEAYAAQFKRLAGTERGLLGYWPITEGNGVIAKDLARFKHAQLKADWDIKPKGTAYDLKGGQYLVMDDVNFVQLTDLMDVTLSFWVKTEQAAKATLFSNGRGNGEDLKQSNGKANKWSVSMEGGILYLHSEGNTYRLSNSNLADNRWHHVGIVLRRIGSLKTYIDAKQESSHPVSEIGGISGNKFWVGARGHITQTGVESVDEVFTGKIDELRLWNLARATEQIDRDRFNEVAFNSMGLMLYAPMNQPDPITGSGPSYYHVAANETVLPSYAKVSAGPVAYTADAPKIKPARPYLTFQVSHVINGDEMILTPLVSDWSVLEGQILDITVDRMFDVHGNRQSSPITWTAYVRRNEVAWFVADGSQQLKIEKEAGQPYSFEVTILNKGGKKQPYSIENIPAWLNASGTSGTLDPNSSKKITFHVDPELSVGNYSLDLFLNTDFNYDEKILLDVRVLATGPDWQVNAADFEHSMNIIGKLKLNGAFSRDTKSKVAAFVGGEVRGVASLSYDAHYDEYFVFLNIFSNEASGEAVSFKIWDAARGKVYQSTIDGEPRISFIKNEVMGSRTQPVIFENTELVEQVISFKPGWTWVSVYAQDPQLNKLNELTSGMDLAASDLIKSQQHFDVYDAVTGWNGSLSAAGGLSTTGMQKVKLAHTNSLTLRGKAVDLANWKVAVSSGWNWFAYPLTYNVSLNEALSMLNALEGDVIKSQTAFAIYDPRTGWSGTLKYLEAGVGYMLKAGSAQEFKYPAVFSNSRISTNGQPTAALLEAVNDWSSYEHNMNIVAEVLSEDQFESVWVIDKQGNVRGKSTIVLQEGRKLSYLTIYGNTVAGELLSLQLGSNEGRIASGQSISFEPNAVLGTISDPLIIRASKGSNELYPNPFTSAFSLTLNAQQAQQAEIKLVNLMGQQVHRQLHQLDGGTNKLSLNPTIPAGVYMLFVTLDGQVQSWKVVKTE